MQAAGESNKQQPAGLPGKEEVYSEKQLGFRKLKGTEDTHVLLQAAILNAFALKQERVAVFFYLKKYYGYNWKYGILKCIH